MKHYILLAALLCAAVSNATDVYPKNQGATIGRADGGYLPVESVNCGAGLQCSFDRSSKTLTVSLSGITGARDYDFPTLGYRGTNADCALSPAITTVGSEVGQRCGAASNLGADGGTGMPTEIVLQCVAGSNVSYVKACSILTDAGTINLPDASYNVIVY